MVVFNQFIWSFSRNFPFFPLQVALYKQNFNISDMENSTRHSITIFSNIFLQRQQTSDLYIEHISTWQGAYVYVLRQHREETPESPPICFPSRCILGYQVLPVCMKNGRRAAATPPLSGWFSAHLCPVRCSRRAQPGPVEQPHHQQPALLPKQLFSLCVGFSPPGGVSFLPVTWASLL